MPELGDGSMGAPIQMQIPTVLPRLRQGGWVQLHWKGWFAFSNLAGKSLAEVPAIFQVPLSDGA